MIEQKPIKQWIMEFLPRLYPKADDDDIKSLCNHAMKFIPDWILHHSNRTIAITLIWITGSTLPSFEDYPFAIWLTQKRICDTLGEITPPTIRKCRDSLEIPVARSRYMDMEHYDPISRHV